MNNFAKVLVATAAVVAVAVVGINLLPGSQTGAGGPPRLHYATRQLRTALIDDAQPTAREVVG